MKLLLKRISALFVAVGLVVGLTACGPQKVEMKNITAVIDVRTPQEYVEGHLDGAVNIDVQASDFVSIIKTLNGNGTYVVYCRSGKRAEVAKQKMAEFGITNVTNAGSMEDASKATGLKILQ